MSNDDFDAALAPLLAASRAAASLDIGTLTADQAESALIITRNLTLIAGQLTDRLHARYPLLYVPHIEPGDEIVLPMQVGRERTRP
jgi:hypothetical protein